jgi:hypothetical protein
VTFLPKVSDVRIETTGEMHTEFWKEILKDEDRFVNCRIEDNTETP